MFQDAMSGAIQSVDLAGRDKRRSSDATLVSWHDLPEILVRRAGWIVGSVLLAMALGLLLSAALPPTYTANTQLLVQPTDLNAVERSVNQASSQGESFVAQIETVARIIGSTKVLERAIEKQRLVSDLDFGSPPSHLRSIVAEIKQTLHLGSTPAATDPMADAVRQLTKRLTIRRSERTFVIDVSVASRDPLKSARIANAIVDAFLEVQASARGEATRRISDSLTSRLGELRDRVRASEDAVQAFTVAHKLVVANGQMVNEQQISEASAQVLVAQNRTADAKSKFDQIDAAANGRDPGAIPESLQSPTIAALRSQMAQAGKAEADARTTLGLRHPQLTQLRSQVESIRRSLNEEVKRIRATARSEYERARTNEASLRGNLERLQVAGTEVNAAQVRLRELEREAEASRGVYQAFSVRARETAEQERVDTLNAWVMSPAVPPSDRSFPPSNSVILGASVLLGAMAGLALGLLRERLDPRLWTRSRVESVTGVPMLATITAPRTWQPPPSSRRSELGPYGAPVALPRCSPQNEDALLGLLQDFYRSRSTSNGRVLLLVGGRGEIDVAPVSQSIAAAAVADGHSTTLVRFGEIDPDSDGDKGAFRNRTASAMIPMIDNRNVVPSASLVDFADVDQPRHVPALVARLKDCIAGLAPNGLIVIASRRDAVALPQLAELADGTVLVVTRSQTTRGEALATAQRLKTRITGLRGFVLVRRTS